jgi:peptidoglycan/xylan/chitin deacetylase (PgdA/CDA1 family)
MSDRLSIALSKEKRVALRFREPARYAVAVFGAVVARVSGAPLGAAIVYHGVAIEPGDPQRELTPSASLRSLRRDLRLARRWLLPVAPSHLHLAACSRRRGSRIPVAITFDDDLESHVEHAIKVVEELSIPAGFFLSGTSLFEPASYWWQQLQALADRGLLPATPSLRERAAQIERLPAPERELASSAFLSQLGEHPQGTGLTASQVRILRAAGAEIGFHTRGHDRLTDLDDDAVRHALEAGRDDLQQVVSHPSVTIAYPHGAADELVSERARGAGFIAGFTTSQELVTSFTDPMRMGRFDGSPISGHAPANIGRALLAWLVPRLFVRLGR